MNGRIALIIIALLATGIIILPQTVSLFAGQHYWYDLSGKESDIPCEKCHADIAAEMEVLTTIHTGETGYGRMKCEYCHRTFPIENKNASFTNYTYAYANGTTTIEPGKEAHAASTVPCVYCHSGNESGDVSGITVRHRQESDCLYCHSGDGLPKYGRVHGNAKYFDNTDCYRCHLYKNGTNIITYRIPPAGGFGLTINTTDTGNLAAHKKFVEESIKDDTLTDANEACIACHTGIAVKINFSHARSLEFDVGLGDTITTDYGPHNWTVTDWATNGTAKATIWGNTSGNSTTTYTADWPGNIDSIYS